MFTIMGATGRVGGQIAARLLRAGEPVRAVGRSKEKLAGLAAAGAEVKVGDAGNASFLADAFRGSEGIFTMMPYDLAAPDFHAQQRSYGEAIAQAVRDSGVHHVVALSSVGAELAAGNGPIACLHDQERRLGAIDGVHLLFLRAAYFFESRASSPMPTRPTYSCRWWRRPTSQASRRRRCDCGIGRARWFARCWGRAN